jgi:hypothetical protein
MCMQRRDRVQVIGAKDMDAMAHDLDQADDRIAELEDENEKLRKALAFIAADRKLTVDHLRGYADGVLMGLDAMRYGKDVANE